MPIVELLPSSGRSASRVPSTSPPTSLRGLGVQLFGLHAPNELVAAAIVDPAWSQRARVAEVAAAHHQRAAIPSPSSRWPTASRPAPRCSRASRRRSSSACPASPTRVGRSRRPRPRWRYGAEVRRAIERPRARATARWRSCSSCRPTRPSTGRGSRSSSSGEPTSASTPSSSRPTVESLPAACRTFLDVTDGLDAARVGYVRAGREYTRVRVEGVSNELRRCFAKRLAPVVDASTVVEDSSDLPRSVSMLPLLGHDVAADPSSVDRALAPEQHHPRPLRRGAARGSRSAGDAAARSSARAPRRDGARPAHAGPARPRRRHDRRGQVRVPAGLGARAWRRSTAPTASRSSSSTTRAGRRSPTASSCRTASASSPTSARTSCAAR